MKQLSLIIILITLLYTAAAGQDNLIMHGKIERISGAKNIILSGPRQFTIPINEDGSFEFSTRIDEPGTTLIRTDSSGASSIWLEPGEYTINCKEILFNSKGMPLFRIPFLKGPKDATIHHTVNEQMYNIRGNGPDDMQRKYSEWVTRNLDSLFKTDPGSKTLPGMIRLWQRYIGDERVLEYQSMLSADQKNGLDSKRLDNYFNRKAKIEKEKFFEDFRMKDISGKTFKLSSLKSKKLILVDFWSSDCYPCRKKHEYLVELYKKYADKGLEIVSISLDDEKDAWLNAVKKDGMTWPNVSELKGWETPLAERYFVKTLPFSFWLDGNRKIINAGLALSDKQIEELLQ